MNGSKERRTMVEMGMRLWMVSFNLLAASFFFIFFPFLLLRSRHSPLKHSKTISRIVYFKRTSI